MQKQNIINFLRRNELDNFFLLANIENYGLHSAFHRTWIKVKDGEIVTVIMVYKGTLLIYDPNEQISTSEMTKLIKETGVVNVHINQHTYSRYRRLFADKVKYSVHRQYLMRCDKLLQADGEFLDKVQDIKRSQLVELVRAKLDTAEFADFVTNYDEELSVYTHVYDKGILRPHGIYMDGQIASAAVVLAQYNNLAMLGNVFTVAKWRRMGLAKNTVYKLAQDLIDEGKSVILFYDDPTAGRLYRALGFYDTHLVYTIAVHENEVA